MVSLFGQNISFTQLIYGILFFAILSYEPLHKTKFTAHPSNKIKKLKMPDRSILEIQFITFVAMLEWSYPPFTNQNAYSA